MQRGIRFGQILADKLEQVGTQPSGQNRRHAFTRPHDPVVLLFDPSGRPAAVQTRRVLGAYGPGYRPTPAPPTSVTPPPGPSTRTLTPRQQHALKQFVALGANLDEHFTARQLKAAFRDLARTYHPDRHPGVSEFEQARLARLFASLHEAYRVLLTLTPLKPAA